MLHMVKGFAKSEGAGGEDATYAVGTDPLLRFSFEWSKPGLSTEIKRIMPFVVSTIEHDHN